MVMRPIRCNLYSCGRLIRPSASRIAVAREGRNDRAFLSTQPQDVAISSTLLARARRKSDEHEALTKQISGSFDSAAAKRLGSLTVVADAYHAYHAAASALTELRAIIDGPGSDKELKEIALDELESAVDGQRAAALRLTDALVPKHAFAKLPCLIEIRPGVGGDEAALFAMDLLLMYTAYCARKGWKHELVQYSDNAGGTAPSHGGNEAMLQEAIFAVHEQAAYNEFRWEAGVHRVQRVPATESKGRTHTSAANVMVLPNLPEADDATDEDFTNPESEFFINTTDVRVDVMRARGAGGQHVNTTDSAVRLTHIPSGIVVACQESRSQLKNRKQAWSILRARVAAQKREDREQELLSVRRSTAGHGKTGRGDKIRTYNWNQQRVTDHRSGFGTQRLGDVMEGGESLEDIMGSVRLWGREMELEALSKLGENDNL